MPIISDNYPMKGLFQCPRKTFGFFSEIEQAKHTYSQQTYIEKIRFYECTYPVVDNRQCTQYHQTVTARNTIYSVHKVIRIDDACADH